MLRILAVASVLALGATAVMAQNAAGIKARQEAMKAMGGAMKEPGGMAKGEMAFDLAKVQASLKTIETQAVKSKAFNYPQVHRSTSALWREIS